MTRLVLPLLVAAAAHAQTPDAARAYRADLLADAAARTATLAPDGAPTVGGIVQFRYDINSADQPPGPEDLTNGFQSRLTTIFLTGTTAQDWVYRVQGNFEADGGAFVLEDAYFGNQVNEEWFIGAGQVRFPVLWEDTVEPWFQLAADKSATNSVFSPGRVQGVWAHLSQESVRAWFAVHDGAGTANSDFDGAAEADFALTARAEYKFAGDWSRFADFTSFRGAGNAGKVGGMVHYQSGGETAGTADLDVVMASADVCWEGEGWNAFGQVVWRTIDPAAGTSRDDLGVVAQAGYLFDDHWEVFGRWDSVLPDDPEDDFSTLTAGVNYYVIPQSHAAKFTADVQYFLDAQSASLVPASTFTGLTPDSGEGQWNVRLQFQVMF